MTCVDTLSLSLRKLVDSRLDSIERVLLCTNVDRSDRREIVQSVEDQIYEMLGRRNESELTRDGVLEVLAMTDPPEAYLTDDHLPKQARTTSGTTDHNLVTPVASARRTTPLAIVSFILGLLSMISLVIWPVSAIVGLAATVCGTIALTQLHYSDHLKGMWLSIIGVCSPAIAMLTLFVLVEL